MSTVLSWNSDDHPRGVHGRFTKLLQKAKVGETVRLQDDSAVVRAISSADAKLKGPNRKVYRVTRRGAESSVHDEEAATVARKALDASARNTGALSLGPGEKAFNNMDEAAKAADGSSGSNTGRFKNANKRKVRS